MTEKPKHLTGPYLYDPNGQWVYRKVPGFGDQRVLDIRAWGYLKASLSLSTEEAIAEQDRIGLWVTELMNSGVIPEALDPVDWNPRGIGRNSGIPDLITGVVSPDVAADCSGFVGSKAEGEQAVKIFGGNAYLDYRPSEPRWVQVKVSAAEPVLDKLIQLVRLNGGSLTTDIVAQVKAFALQQPTA